MAHHENGKYKPLIRFIGSRIKGHLRYGSTWKQKIHGLITTVFITNEKYTSQTYVYCFSKLSKPTHTIKKGNTVTRKTTKVAFLYTDPGCVSKAAPTRDSGSTLAIFLKEPSTLLFGETIPEFRRLNFDQFLTT
ncbi:hypothetical protein K501DRAFT_195399 [Backusella circina FSU 941]|nr:hypothetical protein K501DRAFT_195399 [Backusella circina FSU 941]